MYDLIQDLYEKQVYPPMSHPLSDPAVSAVAAKMSGLDAPHPKMARILEIGCSSGHNLIPLAQRWPQSAFTGIDLSERAIAEARGRAAMAGVGNVQFHAGDLLDFNPTDGPFDYIIAHGFFSWVPDEVKTALLRFCRRHLSRSGIATISFNLECGWKARLPVITKVRAIQDAGGVDEMSALEILQSVIHPDDPESLIVEDMLERGPAILAFDDFAPVNDPWPLDRFVKAAEKAGLRWLGESDPAENFPSGLDEDFLVELGNQVRDPLGFQLAVDEAMERTFRSCVLCRDDASVAERISLAKVLDLSFRAGSRPSDSADMEFYQVLGSFAPACVWVDGISDVLPSCDDRLVVRRLYDGIMRGWALPRIEPVSYDPEPPVFPRLDAFRLACAWDHLPLVDAWHKACSFPAGHYQVLAAMDGSRSRHELEEFSKTHCPELAFTPWLRHLAWRGMFA